MARHAESMKKGGTPRTCRQMRFRPCPGTGDTAAGRWWCARYCYTTAYYVRACLTPRKIHRTRQNMLETHTPCEYSTGSPSSHFKQPGGGGKRHRSLTGEHGVIVSAVDPRVNHVAGVGRIWPGCVVVCDAVMRDIPPVCMGWVAVARLCRAMCGGTEVRQAWGALEAIPVAVNHFQRVNVLKYPQPFAVPPTDAARSRRSRSFLALRAALGRSAGVRRACVGHVGGYA